MATRARPIRVLTADSNQMAVRLLSDALSKEPGLSVVATASDYESFLQSAQLANPDIALISAALPGGPMKTTMEYWSSSCPIRHAHGCCCWTKASPVSWSPPFGRVRKACFRSAV